MNYSSILKLSVFSILLFSCETQVDKQNHAFHNIEYSKGQQPIEGKYWKLVQLDGKVVNFQPNQEREIFFTLKPQEKQIVGFAGCNNINGMYELMDGGRIQFTNMAVNLKACPDVDVNEVEYLEVFKLANNYTINGDRLYLNIGKRAPLAVFEAVYMK